MCLGVPGRVVEINGNTATVDFWGVTSRVANANWLYEVDADGFFALLTERLKS